MGIKVMVALGEVSVAAALSHEVWKSQRYKHSQSTEACAANANPLDAGVTVSWTVDGSVVNEGVLTSPEEQKKDGYTRSSTLTLSKTLWEKGEEFVCTVSHDSVNHPVTFRKSQCED
ncbi:immunoglobulin lambda-1 light chain-like isoform X2 [Silurus asotus]|nr:immunoglobulin lambda-1 light chain-like isoform X2 [Silurus asotus]